MAVLAGAQRLSHGELARLVVAAIAYLRQAGLSPTSRVGIRAGVLRDGQTLDNMIAHLAALSIGASHASLVSHDSVAQLIKSRSIKSFIGAPLAREHIPPSLRFIPFTAALLAVAGPPQPIGLSPRARRLNLSSGTTGTAKLIEWDSAMIAARLDQVAEHLTANTRLLSLLSITTTAGFRYPLATWAAGGAVIFRRNDEEAQLLAAIERSNLLICSPDQLFHRLRKNPGEWAGREERTIIVLGARLPPAVRDEALARCAKEVIISYGSTEGGNGASGDSRLIDRHPGAVGFVRDGVTVRLLDEAGQPCAPGVAGELSIQGDAICRQAYRGTGKGERWFYPGDLAVLHDDGMLAIEGRVTETLNVAGKKHHAPMLETKLAALPGIDECCLCVVSSADRDRPVVAVVCDASLDLTMLRPAIAERLPFRDFGLVRVDRLPRNQMGKISRLELGRELAATMNPRQAGLHA